MRKTVELLNEVVALGFDREVALVDIDATLDAEFGVELRMEVGLDNEEISDELYNEILDGFRAEKEDEGNL